MAHSPRIPKVRKECIPYIEQCGWKFKYYNRPWYVFEGVNGRTTMNGNKEVPFTLTEIREAFLNGW